MKQEGEKPRKLRAAERQRRALELREQGAGYEDIASQLGYSGPSGAFRAVALGLKKTLREPAEGVRKLHLRRFERLLQARFQKAIDGSNQDLDRVLKILEAIGKLDGSYAQSGEVHVRIRPLSDSERSDILNTAFAGLGLTLSPAGAAESSDRAGLPLE